MYKWQDKLNLQQNHYVVFYRWSQVLRCISGSMYNMYICQDKINLRQNHCELHNVKPLPKIPLDTIKNQTPWHDAIARRVTAAVILTSGSKSWI